MLFIELKKYMLDLKLERWIELSCLLLPIDKFLLEEK